VLDKELQKQLERIARRPTTHLKRLYKITDAKNRHYGEVVYCFDNPRRSRRIDLLTKRNEPVVSVPILHRILVKSQRGRTEPASPLGLVGMINYGKTHPQKSSRKKRPRFNLFRRTYRAARKIIQKINAKDLWYRKKRYDYQ